MPGAFCTFCAFCVSLRNAGFSVIEVILAAGVFVIFASAAVGVVIQGFGSNRLSAEYTVATQFAAEGIEAARSIKNQAFGNLSNSAGTGIHRNGTNVWELSGANNTLSHNATDAYIRVLKIEDVRRDNLPPNGNIVSSGGTIDSDAKKITSTVSWNFSSSRPESLSLVTYLTDWRKAHTGDGLMIYGDGSTLPKYRTYQASGSYNLGTDTITGASGLFYVLRTSPRKREAFAGYITATGTLQILCYENGTWTNEWSVTVGGTGTTRRFDLGYETNSGDAMVVYSRNVAANNALAFRTKTGSNGCGSANWSGAANFTAAPAATSGTVHWIRLARDPRASADNLTALWADSNSDLGVNNWSGSAWATGAGTYKALETNLERIAASQDVDNFEVVHESQTGNAMVVWGTAAGANGTNGARYSRCVGGVYTCSWTAAAAVPTVSDDIHNLDMTANSNTNQIVYAANGDGGGDLTAAYWSGAAWTGYANLDTSSESPFAGSRLVSTAWLINGATTRWILNYDDGTGQEISWYSANPGNAPAKQTDFDATPNIGDIRERYDADFSPLFPEQAVLTLTNASRLIFAKKASLAANGTVSWSNADGAAALGTTPAVPAQGFSFAYWRNP